VGLRDEIGVDTAKIFCPKCKSVYQPPPIRSRSGHHSSNSGGGGAVDGAAFGTTFPHLFLMTFNNLVPDPLPQNSTYIPRVFGFRVHQSAHRQGGGPYNPNNGRRGSSYGQRANMTSTRISRGSGGGVPAQVTTSAAAKEKQLSSKASKKAGNDGAAAEGEGGNNGGAEEKATANDGNGGGKKRSKSDGKNSGSSNGTPKRQKTIPI